MSIDDAALDKLAFLARLELPQPTRETVRTDLERMLAFVDVLQQADVGGIEAMAHPAASQSLLRADRADSTDRSEALLALAPAASAGLYLVPRVIE